MIRVVRSELVRLRRRSFLFGWFGLTAGLAVVVNIVMFQVTKDTATAPTDGPGVTFPTLGELLSPSGLVAGLSAASSMFGVVALSFWALAAASDYSTGLVRVLVAAAPSRWRLVLGKWVALAATTAVATLVALLVNLFVAPVAAAAAGYEPTGWGTDLVPTLASATLNLYLALLVWGTIGLALATLLRSAGVAIGIGTGYVLLFEAIVSAAVSSVGNALPGSTIAALASGGDANLAYAPSVALGAVYVAASLALAGFVFARRDITD